MRPIVGITADLQMTTFGAWTEEAALVPTDYTRAVERTEEGVDPVAGIPVDPLDPPLGEAIEDELSGIQHGTSPDSVAGGHGRPR